MSYSFCVIGQRVYFLDHKGFPRSGKIVKVAEELLYIDWEDVFYVTDSSGKTTKLFDNQIFETKALLVEKLEGELEHFINKKLETENKIIQTQNKIEQVKKLT